MFQRYLRFVRQAKSQADNFTYNYIKNCGYTKTSTSNMKAYVRVLKEEDRIEIKLKYVDSNLGLDRWFSFNRSMDDKVQQIKERVVTNIDKACAKYRKRMMKKLGTGEAFKIDVQLMQSSKILDPEISCRNLISMPDVGISVNGQFYLLDIDPPTVKALKLPTSLMAGFPIYPKIDIENCHLDDCEFKWFRKRESSTSTTESDVENDSWSLIGTGFSYVASNLDIGSFLKVECIPKKASRIGLQEVATAAQVVEAGPGLCPFEIRHGFTKDFVGDSGFRVVSYNILADLYADSDYTRTVLHPYCPPYALAIDYRKQLILKELIGYNADIICLQEVDTKVFESDLKPVFTSIGYGAEYSKKGGQVSEGMACLFNLSKFHLKESSSYILAEEIPKNESMLDLWNAIQANQDLSKRVLERTTSCQIAVLESISTKRVVIVANTHLYFHPNADHIRLLQACVALRIAQHIRQREIDNGMDVSLVFCGDFNSCPGSGVYEMMTLQNIEATNAAWMSTPEEAVAGLSLYNPIVMESACGTPPFTNYTTGFSGCLDYIFFEKSKFLVDQVVPLPSLEEITHNTALPSIVFPSDHIALVADLEWL